MVEISDRFSHFRTNVDEDKQIAEMTQKGGHWATCCIMTSQSCIVFAAKIRSFLMKTDLV